MSSLNFDTFPLSGESVFSFPKIETGVGVPGRPARHRSLSLSDVEGGFCRLEVSIPAVSSTDLPELVSKADLALKSGVVPALSEGAMGGTYFLRDASSQKICVVFKPSDEEPFAPNNPYSAGKGAGKFSKAYKGNIFPGFGMYRELVAFALDSCRSGVPATQLAKVHHKSFRITEKGTHDYKLGSVQSYVRDIECSAEDMGPGMMNSDDIQRVAVLDIRLCNLDRHPGNLLVCRSKALTTQEMLPKHCHSPSGVLSSIVEDAPILAGLKGADVSKSCPADVGSYLHSQCAELVGAEAPKTTSPRSVNDNGTSPRTNEGSKLRLVPIDHGYCLPHVLHLSETNFAWLYWPQADAPVSQELHDYIMSLDAEKDCETVRMLVGAAISDHYLLTLRVCTMLLQQGVQAGLTLRAIAKLMTATPTRDTDDEELSPLQIAVFGAVEGVLKMQRTGSAEMSPQRPNSASRLKHSPSESSLVDMEVSCLKSPPRQPSEAPKLSLHTKLLLDEDCVACPATFSSVSTAERMKKMRTPFFPSDVAVDTSAGSHYRCSEADLLAAMNIDRGAALLNMLLMAVQSLVRAEVTPVTRAGV